MHSSFTELPGLELSAATDAPVPAGESRYEVELLLPADMAGSMQVESRTITCPRTKRRNNARVVWFVGAKVEFEKGGSTEPIQALEKEVFVAKVAAETDKAQGDRQETSQQLASCFCCTKGELQLEGSLAAASYTFGDTLRLTYGVKNLSKVDCKDLLVEVWQHSSWEAGGKRAHEAWLMVDATAKGARRGAAPDEGEVLELQLPSEGPCVPTTDLGSLSTHHFVRLTPRFATCSLVTRVPALTVPFTLFCRPSPAAAAG